jgi:hypothetical protein
MATVMLWQCGCGTELRAEFQSSRNRSHFRCPNPSCGLTHSVDGELTNLSQRTSGSDWDFNWYTIRIVDVLIEATRTSSV